MKEVENNLPLADDILKKSEIFCDQVWTDNWQVNHADYTEEIISYNEVSDSRNYAKRQKYGMEK